MIRKLVKQHIIMFALFMGNARMNALEDAYNTLVKLKNSREVKVVKKG